jgi:hypothetical protein
LVTGFFVTGFFATGFFVTGFFATGFFVTVFFVLGIAMGNFSVSACSVEGGAAGAASFGVVG